MTPTHDTDNDEPLFHFDAYDTALAGGFLDDLSLFTPRPLPRDLPGASHRDHPTSDGTAHSEVITLTEVGKGKAVSAPLPIRTATALDQAHDVFDMSPSSSSSSTRLHPRRLHFPSPSPAILPRLDTYSVHTLIDGPFQSVKDNSLRCSDLSRHDLSPGKGKGREPPPVLPPLVFSPTEFDYGQVDWPSPSQISSTPGPSSYGSGYGSPDNAVLFHTPNQQAQEQLEQKSSEIPQQVDSRAPTIRRIPSRRRSLSSLSTHSTRSLAARSVSRLKLGASKVPSTLARRLLFRKRQDTADAVLDPQRHRQNSDPGSIAAHPADLGHRSRFMSWRGDVKSRSRPSSDIVAFDPVASAAMLAVSVQSSPLPHSFLDIIAPECTDIFTPLPIVIPNYFAQLPRELQLRVLSSLLVLHELEHARCKAQGQWTVLKASSSRNQWVGQERGIKELVKFSRVSVIINTMSIRSDLNYTL